MAVSRSFASPDPDAAPVFPLLPFAYMAYADHCQRDVAGYVDKLAHADETPLKASETFGLQMLSDMNQAFFSLVWAPFDAAMQGSEPPAP